MNKLDSFAWLESESEHPRPAGLSTGDTQWLPLGLSPTCLTRCLGSHPPAGKALTSPCSAQPKGSHQFQNLTQMKSQYYHYHSPPAFYTSTNLKEFSLLTLRLSCSLSLDAGPSHMPGNLPLLSTSITQEWCREPQGCGKRCPLASTRATSSSDPTTLTFSHISSSMSTPIMPKTDLEGLSFSPSSKGMKASPPALPCNPPVVYGKCHKHLS